MVKRGIDELGVEKFCQKAGIVSTPQSHNPEKELVAQLLTTAYQGTKNSSDDTFSSAESLAKSIGATFYHWEIDEEVQSYTAKIESHRQKIDLGTGRYHASKHPSQNPVPDNLDARQYQQCPAPLHFQQK